MDVILSKRLLEELSILIEQIIKVNTLAKNKGCIDGKIIGTGRSDYTQNSTMYSLNIMNKKFAMIDIPGIEGDESAYERIIKKSLEQAHLIFYVNGSGKKIEKESLVKIKKYMHDGTSVYAIFNTHCKAKKERIIGIDKTYSEELREAYKKQKEIIKQTEKELVSFLGSNYKGNINMNGLLAFCSVAFQDEKKTSIINDKEKNLQGDQKKYLLEYANNIDDMKKESHLYELIEIIEKKVDSFETDIIEENIKKLKKRMTEMCDKISFLKTTEYKKIDGFISIYEEFVNNCYHAKEDFITTMKHVANNAATEAFYDLMDNQLFPVIEESGGKNVSKTVQSIMEREKGNVVARIQNGVNRRIQRALEEFKESIKDAQERMKNDFEREQISFEVSLSADNLSLDTTFADALKYNLGDFGKHAFTIGSLTLSGASVGSVICPGLGTAIGAGIGAILGILGSIWNFFASREQRINKAKTKLRKAIDDQIDEVTEQLAREMRRMNYEDKINGIYNSLYDQIDKQKKELLDVKKLIVKVENEMYGVYKNIA